MKLLAAVLALVLSYVAQQFVAFAGDAVVLTTVSVQFDTTTNDKDHDTRLDVRVFNNRGTLIAQKTGITGKYEDHSSNSVVLDLSNNLEKKDVPAGRIALAIHPNGNDKWEFNYTLEITYSDNSTTQKSWSGKVLTQTNSTTANTWNGY